MNKEQTKTPAERYVAPSMNEHVLLVKRHILEGSVVENPVGYGTDITEEGTI